MWKCTRCSHLDVAVDKPSACPICGAGEDEILPHEVEKIKGETILNQLKSGMIAESQASIRNRAFAMMADQEGLPQIAGLFRAVAEAEAVHAFNHMQFLGAVSDTQTNLQNAFEHENLAASAYPKLIQEATEAGDTEVARLFGFVRDVEGEHAKLYSRALDHMVSDRVIEYFVCSVCGHIEEGAAPDECPVCGAPQKLFRKVV